MWAVSARRGCVAALIVLVACGGAAQPSPSVPGGEPNEARSLIDTSLSATPTLGPTDVSPTPTTPGTPTPPSTQPPSPTRRPPSRPYGVVSRIVDGDTIEVQFRGRTVDVRLIGVDTPETVAPGQPVECYGYAATGFTRNALESERVRLEFDVERLDRYGRTLAYVWIGGELFNERLVAEGYASVLTIPPNVKYQDRFLAAAREAREEGRGLWSACVEPEEPPEKCDSAYPGRCIPPSPPDLDCADVAARDFRVIGADPHDFDGDGDGVGCESPPPPPTEEPDPPDDGGDNCTPGYSPCLPPASDYDCAGGSGNGPAYTGTVRVTGSDPYGLDSDGDGFGCE